MGQFLVKYHVIPSETSMVRLRMRPLRMRRVRKRLGHWKVGNEAGKRLGMRLGQGKE